MRIAAVYTRTEHIDEEFGSIAEFRKLYPNFRIESVDDREVLALCEICEEPIFEGEEYGGDEDGEVLVHVKCAGDDDGPNEVTT